MIAIEHLSAPTPEARQLIAELERVLGALYQPEQRHGLSIEQVFQPNLRFFAARLGGAAVGCGGVALFDDYAEVKRMYTREAARGQGVGKTLLARLEQEARDAGKPVLRLEPAHSRRRRSVRTSAAGSRRAVRSAITPCWSRTTSPPACSTKSAFNAEFWTAGVPPACGRDGRGPRVRRVEPHPI